ncbi:MAG: hypothetical protein ACF8XB_01315 [Planctomycetota bacterium JB042]
MFRTLASALAVVAVAVPSAAAGNGSNYVHLTNGLDYFFGKTPPAGKFTGIWRCFPGDMLHAPTIALTGPRAGTYATKVCAVHLAVAASAGSTIAFPVITLSSSSGTCRFLTSAGGTNFGLFSAAGLGTFVGGPLTGNGGPTAVTLLGGIVGASLANPATSPGLVVFVTASLPSLLGQTIDVPPDESLVLWVQDDPNQFGAGTMQYWHGSFDERNLCSGYSFLLSGNGVMSSFASPIEWAIGFGTRDATLSTAIASLGAGPSSLNAHDALLGFSPGFDAGSGTRTISITGTGGTGLGSASIGSEFLAFNVYDEQGPSNRLAVANLAGFDPAATATGTCSNRSATFQRLPTGGPGGPVLDHGIPTLPRSVGKFDAVAVSLLWNLLWISSTNHATIPGGNNIPYFPAAAPNGGSNAGGNAGGFPLPLPPHPSLPGTEIFFWNFNVDPTNTFLEPTAAGGHKLTNGYPVLLFP